MEFVKNPIYNGLQLNTVNQGQIVSNVESLSISGSTNEIDCNLGNCFILALSAAAEIQFTNVLPGGSYVLTIDHGDGGYTISMPSGIEWGDNDYNTEQSSGANEIDLVNLYYDGVNWFGSYILSSGS